MTNGIGWAAFVLAIAAFALAAVSLIGSQDPLNLETALTRFDFSTPQKSIRSLRELERPSQRAARLALYLDSHKTEQQVDQELRSLKVGDVLERDGIVYCFSEWADAGVPKRDVVQLELKRDRYVVTFRGSVYMLEEYDVQAGRRKPVDSKAAQILTKWRAWKPEDFDDR